MPKQQKKKQYTFLESLAHAFEHREIVTYEDKIKRDRDHQEKIERERDKSRD